MNRERSHILTHSVDIHHHDHVVFSRPAGHKDNFNVNSGSGLDEIPWRFDIEFFFTQFAVPRNTQLKLEGHFASIGKFDDLAIRKRVADLAVIDRFHVKFEVWGHHMTGKEDLKHFLGATESETEGFAEFS